MKQSFDLLASAATLAQIRECITRFYCGTSITLIPAGHSVLRMIARILAGAIEAICLFVAFAFILITCL